MFEDTKGVIRRRKLKNRQHNDQEKKYKRTNNDLQNITYTHTKSNKNDGAFKTDTYFLIFLRNNQIVNVIVTYEYTFSWQELNY